MLLLVNGNKLNEQEIDKSHFLLHFTELLVNYSQFFNEIVFYLWPIIDQNPDLIFQLIIYNRHKLQLDEILIIDLMICFNIPIDKNNSLYVDEMITKIFFSDRNCAS